MMRNPDYLPRKDALFLQWMINFLEKLSFSASRFNVPEEVYAALRTKGDVFVAGFAAAENPTTRTKATVRAKNDARNDLEQAVRQVVRQYLAYNTAMTDSDRVTLGLPSYKTTRSRSPVASTYPDSYADSGMIRRLIIHFYDRGSVSKAKPAGQHGVEIRWAISDTPVTDVEELTRSSFDTRTPFTLEFGEQQRGKSVYFCLCWENTRGEKGPWSKIQRAVIP
jgi:hypothetical protein